ncbi:hypothetical protein F4778DRAFT_97826 [Xylariomycetidae sp. FL2044]|nr:hypothetical protein F4778DRAFT_97826 [Xylariomycetidae sp. FL2044]
MQLHTIVALGSLAGIAAADCYSDPSGRSSRWQGNQIPTAVIEKICNDGTFNGAYEGSGDKKKRAHVYRVNGDTWPLERFEISRLGSSARDLPNYECVSGLTKEVMGCEYGGGSKYTNWEYKSRPIGKIDSYGLDEPIENITVST